MSGRRTGHVGDCYEYWPHGEMLAGADQGTIDYLVALSAQWPETYHQYVREGYVTWAHGGREISESELPPALRGCVA